MSSLFDLFLNLKTNRPIVGKKDNLRLNQITDSYNQLLVSSLYLTSNETVFVVLPNLYMAQQYYDGLSTICGAENVLFYPADEMLSSLMALSSQEFKIERIYTLGSLINQDKRIVVTNQNGAMKRQLSKEDWMDATRKLEVGKEINRDDLIGYLVSHGYSHEYTVTKTGEFGLRGSILDIFPIGAETPYRVDFFGDEVDRIKLFKPDTQLSIGETNEISILPMNELFFNDHKRDQVIEQIEAFLETKTLSKEEYTKFNTDLDHLYNRRDLDSLTYFTHFFNPNPETLFDFTDQKTIIYVDEHKMAKNYDRMDLDLADYLKQLKGEVFYEFKYYLKMKELMSYPHIEITGFTPLNNDHLYSVYARDEIIYQGNVNAFIDEIKKNKGTYVVSMNQPQRFDRIKDLFEEAGIDYICNPRIIEEGIMNLFYPMNLPSTYLQQDAIHFLNEQDIFDYKSHKRLIRYKSVISEAIKISSVEELKVGDFVVHYDYGIGQYKGLQTMELGGHKKDYIHIAYQGTDFLYIPIDQIDMILKYSSRDGHVPTLTKLGTASWNNTKKRVKEKLNDISDKLIKLYAERENAEGFSFPKDDQMQLDFENSFEFEETIDQLKAIKDVKKDMESKRPMDRLLIGDVGYGKTEVAMRAAFKAVVANKQVCYLVPTTVLARQHFYAFKKRFEPFGINVELLSRFVSDREQNETLKKMEKGLVDVVIGTHRLLSKDIVFKDLGLLIIDEEQRFGVEHKEKIKEMRINVDVLSLSATPIPRTLQMSLMGIKDLTMIETPPLNRYPIQTYVLERHEAIIKEAIERELARAGQVFYLYNKVSDMESVVRKLFKLVPEAKITFAHGKMSKDVLEDRLSEFIDRRFDVLVSTTIIETGIDIPNTNTLIIHDADRLGLSQLYQIRGRVGRSDKIAYAYLMYQKNKDMSDDAIKRLQTIKDFTELGSGFKIAMRDLSIRGAGDILGDEQSGFIDSVGMELYLKLLEESVNEKKGIKKEAKKEQQDIVLSARHIDENYISSDEVRVEIHKRISSINTLNEAKNLEIELEDRFGRVDQELIVYMYEKLFKKYCSKLGVEKTIKSKTDLTILLSIEASKQVNGEKLFLATNEIDASIQLGYLHERVSITLIIKQSEKHYLYQFIEYLSLITS
ncbi:Transcription-repair coupling factor (Superfamily II helicase) [Paracholeplasma brassicae]|uniref:Transcription-repair-coupling factor n=1 Tax=Acholeplasma brassicae TaxID=61635 RepID=U4KSI3_9MOLU|nr:transcription-repair coupling factor [Paracholeplasma brassicae]CCV65039.1 Transcription-repair coupling factor (Superfamily II helicase) [Paracholeplasma brassicae]